MTTPPNPEEAIVDAALEMPAHERAAYLDKLCGNDPQLRRLVDALLHAHKKIISSQIVPPRDPSAAPTQSDSAPPLAEGAPERRAPGVTTLAVSVTPIEKPGDHIGRYKLLQQIGEGGGGIVYMAEQVEPVRRRVALKILKLGMDTKQVIARFEAERQALALMDHPNIAQVHDAGATETGRPYFVMELVRGIKITDYCDQKNVSTEKRLDLFIQVCKAVQHAHQKGIIHRDIKPSNILVTLHDGVPVPKIIDFGIAKATTGQPLTDKTVFTAFEQFIGTPAYMSPEQAEMSGLDIDTRSDIYALGVLLYELLTGQMPFDPKELVASGFEEMRRIIRTEDPPRPSTRLSNLDAADQTTVAKCRQVEAPKLVHLIRGDLDWIVMKCLEKDRVRRYDTANGLASDIERHLNSEPVVARPPSNLYRFQKLVRRNKLAFAAGAVVTLTILLGLLGSFWQAMRATRAERIATQQRDRADESARAERAQRQRAEQSARESSEALSVSLLVEGDRLAREDAAGKALAYFARALRLNPSNRVAATRIVSLLNQRNFPLPLTRCPDGFDPRGIVTNYATHFHRRGPFGSEALVLKEKSILDQRSGRELSRVTFDGEPDRDPVFSLDGEKMAVLTSSKLEVFFTRTGEQVMPAIPARHSGSPPFALFTPDSRNLIVGGRSSGEVEVWDLVGKRQRFAALPHASTVWALAVSTDGRRLASGVRTGEARLWDLRTGQPAGEPCPGTVDIVEDVISRSGEFLLTKRHPHFGGRSPFERFWDVRPGQAVPLSLWHSAAVQRACYSPSGEWVATVCSDGTAWVWTAGEGAVQSQPMLPGDRVEKLVFSPDSLLIALGGSSGKVGLWSVKANQLLWSRDLHSDKVSQLVFSPDGAKLVTAAGASLPGGGEGDTNSVVDISEVGSGILLAAITNGFGTAMSLAISPDSRRLAIAYRHYRAEIWDLEKKERLGDPLTRNNGWVWHVCFSHDGRWLATSSGGNATQLWDALAPVNRALRAYPHGNGVHLACFSSDDKLVLTCSGDRTARVWEQESGKPVTEPLPLEAFQFPVIGGGFSEDNRAVLVASGGGAKVWDVQSGRALCESFRNNGRLLCATFSPDGTHILTAGGDRAARIFSWLGLPENPPAWLPKLAELVGGYRLSDNGVAEPVDKGAEELAGLRVALAGTDESGPLVKWGRWYLADRSARTIDASSSLTVRDYARRLAKQESLAALEEAQDLDPANPVVYAKLARFVETSRPETADLYRRFARELGASEEQVGHAAIQTPVTKPLAGPPAPATTELLDARDGQVLLQRIGQTVTVKGQLVAFGTSRSGTYRYLNFAKNYSAALTLAFHVSDNPGEFRPEVLRGFLNKTVTVTGTVSKHQGVPQILMTSLSQIRVVDVPETPGSPP